MSVGVMKDYKLKLKKGIYTPSHTPRNPVSSRFHMSYPFTQKKKRA
jgi:hypothetical protein